MLEDRVQQSLGNLLFQNMVLQERVGMLQQEVADKTAELQKVLAEWRNERAESKDVTPAAN